MLNSWVTTDGAAATRAFNQDVRKVHAQSLRKGRATSASPGPQRAQPSVIHSREVYNVSPFIIIHHDHTNVVSHSDHSGNTQCSPLHADSATMTVPELPASTTPFWRLLKPGRHPAPSFTRPMGGYFGKQDN